MIDKYIEYWSSAHVIFGFATTIIGAADGRRLLCRLRRDNHRLNACLPGTS